MPGTETIRGVVSHCYFSSPTFSAGRLRDRSGDEMRFSGKLYLRSGEAIVAKGQWVHDAKYGKQFAIDTVDVDSDLDASGLANWLSFHPAAIGIGPVRARKIAESFGQNFEQALRERPEEIAAVANVPVENILALAKEWASRVGFNAVATQLAAVGLTKHQIESLIEACGSTVVQALREDPYSVLGRVPGFGFKRVDDIARKNYGVAKENERRIDAGILYCLKQALEDGSTCLSRSDLCGAAEKALFLDGLDAEQVICDRIDELAHYKHGMIVSTHCKGVEYFALPWIYQQERFVAEFLKTGDSPNPCELPEEFVIECDKFFELDKDQSCAAMQSFNKRIAVMSGGAGCGKTTTIKAIATIYQHFSKTVALCCPTGKAARRLSQVSGLPAQTIHRLLEYSPILERFTRDADNPIAADVVIVDEVSMVPIDLAYHLFQAIGPQTAVLLVGDHHQLPPVGPGALLRDCIAKNLVPTKILSHCHRQAGVLKRNCAAILDGEIVFEKGFEPNGVPTSASWCVDARHDSDDPSTILRILERLWTELIPQWGYDVLLDTQILSGMHRGAVGTRSVNIMLQYLRQQSLGVRVAEVEDGKSSRLYVGDKVICIRNNYQLEIMNGMQGLVKSIKPLVITFDGRDVEIPADKHGIIQLAYCLTPHKCQGSEWGCIVVICHKEQWIMHSRNWLYTSVTRAQKTCVVIGDKWSIEGAARRVKPNQRCTLLGLVM